MSILDDIQRADTRSAKWRFSSEDVDEAAESAAAAMNEAWEKRMEGMIILDPKLDPDPHGSFNMPLVDRLKTMGWP